MNYFDMIGVMNTTAIQQAFQLYKHPEQMQWLSSPDTQLPEGVTDLLRLSASKERLNQFSKKTSEFA